MYWSDFLINLQIYYILLIGVPFVSAMCKCHSNNNNVYLTIVIPLINMYKALYNIYKRQNLNANDVHKTF